MIEASVWFSGWTWTRSLASSAWCRPFRIAPARHHAAGELVDDHHLAVADDVVLVALEQRVGAQRLVDVVDEGGVLGVVEVALLQEARLAQHLLDLLVAALGERHGALLLVEVVIGLARAAG